MKTYRNYRYLVLCILSITLYGCKAIAPITTIPDPYESPKDIVILIDGTSNTPEDNTNINKLRKQLKKRDDLVSFYTVGVGGGPDFAITGMAMGVGISKDVREAYQFISENYDASRNDRIHLFGFSRGAYTAQILSNFIYTAGIVDLSAISTQQEKTKLLRKMYKAYLGDRPFTWRKRKVTDVLKKWKTKTGTLITRAQDVEIDILGLFDNVEALAAPDYKEKFCAVNTNHLNQYINVKKVLHAVALDDNRAQIFTPILATCPNIRLKPEDRLDDIVTEVWFSGAHSDVGGGYTDDPEISYVSLDWMIRQTQDYNLFDEVTVTDTHINGVLHDSEDNLIGALYRRRNRDIVLYFEENGPYYNQGKLKIHSSVIKRLAQGLQPYFKYSKKYTQDWFDQDPFCDCFVKDGDKRIFQKDDCTVIEEID